MCHDACLTSGAAHWSSVVDILAGISVYRRPSTSISVLERRSSHSTMAEKDDEYEVEQIVDHRLGFYLVKWRGYAKPMWEPVENLTHCDGILASYHDSPGLLHQLCSLSLKPSTQCFTWPFVREVARINCTQKMRKVNRAPNWTPIKAVSKLTVQLPVWEKFVNMYSEVILYTPVGTVMVNGVISFENKNPEKKGVFKVNPQFPLLKTQQRGNNYTVDFSYGVVKATEDISVVLIEVKYTVAATI